MAVGKTARNERLKLFAGLLNNGPASCFAIGVVAPLAASVYNQGNVGGVPLTVSLAWVLPIILMHGIAQAALGRLRD